MMEINNKPKLLRAPPNLTLGVKKDQQFGKNGVSSCNLSRIVDKTQRTQYKQEQSILNDFGVLLNTKRQQDQNSSVNSDNDNDNNDSGIDNYEQKNFDSRNKKRQRYIQNSQNNNNRDSDYNEKAINGELEKIYQKYQKALQILTNQQQLKVSPVNSFYRAYQILSSLIDTIRSQKYPHFLKYDLVQSIILNYWKVGNDLFFSSSNFYHYLLEDMNEQDIDNMKSNAKKQQLMVEVREKEKIIENVREVFAVLEQLLDKINVKGNKLTVLALIVAKEYFRLKNMGQSLEWCEKGFRYCPKFKNTSVLLKLHYMKSKIYSQIHANQPEFEQIKKCIFFLKTLSQNTTENKEFSHEFMKNLVNRKEELKKILEGRSLEEGSGGFKFQSYNKSTQKSSSGGFAINKGGSLNKFRNRSISLSKLRVMNQDGQLQKPSEQNPLKVTFKKSLHQQMLPSSSAYNLMKTQAKKDFLKLDINRKTKLKKKGQTLTIWQKNSQKINFQNQIAKQLQKTSITVKGSQQKGESMLRNLMLRRPNERKGQNEQNKGEYEENSKKLGSKGKGQDLLLSQQQKAQSKEKLQARNAPGNTPSNLPGSKAQSLKDQYTSSEQQKNYQSNLKSRLVVTTKSDSQLIKFISSIQEEVFGRYFAKSLKYTNLQANDDVDGDVGQKDESSNDYGLGNQFMVGKGTNPLGNQINISSVRGKANNNNNNEYKDHAIEQESNDSGDSNTRNFMMDSPEDDEGKLVFSRLISRKDNNNAILTVYGVLQELSLQVRKRKHHHSVRQRQSRYNSQHPPNQATNLKYRFIVTLKLNDSYYKAQFQFPMELKKREAINPTQAQHQEEEQNFEDEFHRWVYQEINKANTQSGSAQSQESNRFLQTIIMKQSVQNGLDKFLIEKITSSLLLHRKREIGYVVVGQKSVLLDQRKGNLLEDDIIIEDKDFRDAHDYEWERESIFEWREKNFQYVKQSLIILDQTERNNVLTIDWKSKNTIKSIEIEGSNNRWKSSNSYYQAQEETSMKSMQSFFIELQKMSTLPSQANEENDPLLIADSFTNYVMNRYNMEKVRDLEDYKGFIDSYILYRVKNRTQLCEDLGYFEGSRQEGPSDINISGVSSNVEDESYLRVRKFENYREGQQTDNKVMDLFDDQILTKIQYLKKASLLIGNSYFPKFKYLQFTRKSAEFIAPQKAQPQRDLHDNQSHIQEDDNQASPIIDQFIIKIIGMQPSEPLKRKKGSVRKSQIIQLHQNLNHSNFMKEVFKYKPSSLHPEHHSAELSYKRPELMNKTISNESSDGKQSAFELNVNFRKTSKILQVQNSNIINGNTKSMYSSKRKSFQEQAQKTQISKASMVKILKRALIQPDYKKSTLLMTYFDSLQIKSFFNIMGTRPNYIKLTCFKLKSIYIQDQQSVGYYYLFELQQREARTRMHKFIIGDRQISKFIESDIDKIDELKSIKSQKIGFVRDVNNVIEKQKKNNDCSFQVRRRSRHTKTLPQKKNKTIIKIDSSNDEVLSDENKNHVHYKESVTSSRLKTKKSIFQSQFQNYKKQQQGFQSIKLIHRAGFSLKFTEESLTEVMKLITPCLVIKKDYLYTSICLKSVDPIFYLMNKFTVQNEEIANGNDITKISSTANIKSYKTENFYSSEDSEQTSKRQTNTNKGKLKPLNSDFLKVQIGGQNQQKKAYFLSQQMKSKRILCQKSLVLEISQNLARNLEANQSKKKRVQTNKQNISKYQTTRNLSHIKLSHTKNRLLFSILTIIKISKSKYFTIKLYIPKFQRSYTLTLDKSFINYLQFKDFWHIFGEIKEIRSVIQELQKVWGSFAEKQGQKKKVNEHNKKVPSNQENRQFSLHSTFEFKKKQLIEKLSFILFEEDTDRQKLLWKKVLSLIKIQEKNTHENVYLIMKIANFHGFIKDCSFLQFFEKDGNIYMLQMTINKKSQNCQYFPKEDFVESLQGKNIKRGLLTGKQNKMKFKKNRVEKSKQAYRKCSKGKKLIDVQQINCHNQEFQKLASIYESKAEDYTLYVQIFKIYEENIQKKQKRNNKKNSINPNFGKTTQREENQIDSEMIVGSDCANRVNQESERESQVSFSEFKSNDRLIRMNTFRNTLKSTSKSINFQTAQKNQHSSNHLNYFSRLGRLKSNYKLMNPQYYEKASQELNEFTKINFSFYLCQLNSLFKYIDENYSEEFNEEFFVLAQMNTGFKMLGNLIIEEFKGGSQKKVLNTDEDQIPKRFTQKKRTLIKDKDDKSLLLIQNINRDQMMKKRSLRKKLSNQYSSSDQIGKQVGFGQISSVVQRNQKSKLLNTEQQEKSEDGTIFEKTLQKKKKQPKFTTEQLFEQYQNQKSFKKKIIYRLKQFGEKLSIAQQTTLTTQIDFVKEDMDENDRNNSSDFRVFPKNVSKSKSQTLKVLPVSSCSQPTISQRQRFISLHSKLSNMSLIDLHLLSSEQKSHKLSSLFFEYDSLLFLISNVRSYEIFTISIKVDQEHPFSFIQILHQKNQLGCIRNRLFKYYRNLLLLMVK